MMTEEKDNKKALYEKEELNVARIIGIGLLSVVLLAASVFSLNEFFFAEKEQQISDVVLKPESTPFREMRAREDEILNSYKIIDSDKKIYQIPIEQAMKLMADEAYQAKLKSSETKKQ